MKVAILCLVVLLSTSQAVQLHKTLTNSQIRRIENLKKTNTWGSALMNLAELHIAAGGPIDGLVEAIEEVVSDIEHKLDGAHADFDKRTNEHNQEVRRLTDLINEASRNIADTQELINNVLIPQRDQLNEEITELNRRVAETQAYMEQQTNERATAHEDFLTRMDEHNEAIAALDEAIELLNTLGSGESLVQVKKIQNSVAKVQKKVKQTKFLESSLVQALLSLTTSEFADSSAVARVKQLMVDVRANLQQSIVEETANEEAAQEAFTEDMARCTNIIAQCQAELNEKNEQLTRTEEQIAAANDYIEQRSADRTGYQNDLAAENDAYDEATRNYNDLVAQLTKEHDACNEALDVIENASIADYIGGRMEQDRVIDTNHGSGVRVGGDDIEFQ